MKKILSCFLCMILVLSLVGCMPNEVQTISTVQSTNTSVISELSDTNGQTEGAGINALTGLPVLNSGNALRPVAVPVDNYTLSWPNSGLSEADVVFEVLVWENITRFAALYSDYKELPVVGPVRELYMPLLQCVFSTQPVFVTDAISAPCETFIEENAYTPYIFNARYGQNAVWINESRLTAGTPTERTRYTDGGNLAGAIQVYGTDMQSNSGTLGFSFASEDMTLPTDAIAAENMQIAFAETNLTTFSFDAATVRYQMAQYESYHNYYAISNDENTGSQIAFDNVLVLFADVTERDDAENDLYQDSLVYNFEKGGEGYYCYGGLAVPISWQKGGENEPFQLSANGIELQIHPGTTYVAVVDKAQGQNELFE